MTLPLLKGTEDEKTAVSENSVIAAPVGDHPPGTPSGGTWGTNSYIGSKTQVAACVGLLAFFPSVLCIFCCPCDERDVYKVGNDLYLADGKRLPRSAKFKPKQNVMTRS